MSKSTYYSDPLAAARRIPSTIDAASNMLDQLEGLITARSWERAAIVYAFTHGGGSPGPKADRGNSAAISFRAFAKLGIAGLRSDNTVRAYHDHWQYAIDQGKAIPVGPGDPFVEPDLDFPPNPIQHAPTRDEIDGALAKASPAAIARRAAEDQNVARAIARNRAARENVEEHGIEARTLERPELPESLKDPEATSERFRRGMGRALGKETDMATDLIDKAVGDMAQAILAKEKWGIDYPEAEAEALDTLDRYLAAYRSGSTAKLTDDDRGWLETIGVEL